MRKSDHDYAKARELRRTQSLPEGLIWRELRGNRTGLKIRRQQPVGPFVLDFYCAAAKLAIEIDGVAHDMGKRPEADIRRTEFLNGQGISVIRFLASDVLKSPTEVAERIHRACEAQRR